MAVTLKYDYSINVYRYVPYDYSNFGGKSAK